jgi:Flp pilus assembly protein TadG
MAYRTEQVRGARRSAGRPGQAMVEFALVLPLFLLLTAGIMQLAQTYYAYTMLLQAAQEGARCGAVLHRTDSEIIACVQAVAPGRTADPVYIYTITSSTNSTAVASAQRGTGNLVIVWVSHAQPLSIPFFTSATWTLHAYSHLIVE